MWLDAWNNLDSTEDWDNEEYTGSLADTKVFTPSTSVAEPPPPIEEPKTQDLQTVQSNQNVNLSLLQQEVRNYQILFNVLSIIDNVPRKIYIFLRNCQNCRKYHQYNNKL